MTTNKLSEFAAYVVHQLETNKDEFTTPIQLVTYGDQNQFPVTPSVAVEPENKENDLSQGSMQRFAEINFTVSILVYYEKIDSVENNKVNADRLAEEIEEFLHKDPTCGGLVTHSYVTSLESGYAYKRDSLYRASRLIFTGKSKHRLGTN